MIINEAWVCTIHRDFPAKLGILRNTCQVRLVWDTTFGETSFRMGQHLPLPPLPSTLLWACPHSCPPLIVGWPSGGSIHSPTTRELWKQKILSTCQDHLFWPLFFLQSLCWPTRESTGNALQVAVEQRTNLGVRQNWLHSLPQPLTSLGWSHHENSRNLILFVCKMSLVITVLTSPSFHEN